MRRRRISLPALLAGVLLVAAVGCGGKGGGGGTQNQDGPGNPGAQGKQTIPADFYGLAPKADPSVKLQPDVVLVNDGPKAIRGASGDGLTWTLDDSAPGVKDLKVGSVMMASTFATGRVAKIDHQGGNAIVTLAPVSLTDIIKDGELKVDNAPVDLADSRMMYLPDLPALTNLPKSDGSGDTPPEPGSTAPDSGSTEPSDPPNDKATDEPADGKPTTDEPSTDQSPSSEPSHEPSDSEPSKDPGDTATDSPADHDPTTPDAGASTDADGVLNVRLPPIELAAAGKSSPLGPLQNGKATVKVGDWVFEPYTSSNQIRIRVMKDDVEGKKGLKVGYNFFFNFLQPSVSAATKISNGQVQSSSFNLNGLQSIGVDLGAGSANGLQDNSRVRVEVPINIYPKPIPIPGAPLPMAVTFKSKVVVEFGFTSKDSTISATGQWDIHGSLGSPGGVTVTQSKSLIDSLNGASMGGTGVVVAFELKGQLGIGIPGFTAGPYGKFVLSVGMNDQSAMPGVAGQHCRSATVILRFTGGVGVEASQGVIDYLKQVIDSDSLKKIEFEKQIGGNGDVYNHDFYTPHIDACNPNKK